MSCLYSSVPHCGQASDPPIRHRKMDRPQYLLFGLSNSTFHGAHLNESNQLLKISTHDWLQFLVECNFEKVESCIPKLVLTFDTIIYLDNIFLLHNSEFYAQTFNTLYSIISFSNSINELE